MYVRERKIEIGEGIYLRLLWSRLLKGAFVSIQLERVWGTLVLDLREEGDLGRQVVMVWAWPVSFFF